MTLNKDKYSNEYYKYKNKFIPLRYMAFESIKKDEFTTNSDIYACGILIWECLSKAKSLPFEQLDNEAFLKAVQDESLEYKTLLEAEGVSEGVKPILVSSFSVIMRHFKIITFLFFTDKLLVIISKGTTQSISTCQLFERTT